MPGKGKLPFVQWGNRGRDYIALGQRALRVVEADDDIVFELDTAGLVKSKGGVHANGATGLVGYGAGAGGAVTQITSITTGVTLSKPTGQITTVAATTAAAAEETFTVTNTLVAATDVVVISTTYAGAGTPMVYCKKVAAGSFDITIANLHATAALDALLVINFAVIKGVAS